MIAIGASKMSAQASLFAAPLHSSQAIEVERALTIWGEPFTADAAHTQIFVNPARRRDVVLRLTLAGMPHRYVPTTADVLDQPQSAFASQTIVDDRRRSGVEGDIVASLRRIAGVADAMVVIAPAIDDPLAGDARTPATASVQLVMQSGAQLSGGAVSGIKRFVAASYPGLAAERVVVVDGTGNAVSVQASIDRAASRESRLQNSIQSALDAVFGAQAAIVRVSVRSIGEERSSRSTRMSPHGLIETDSGKERGAEGGKNFEKERNRRRYAYDTLEETSTSHADMPAHVAVAVFLDSRRIGLDQAKLVADLVRAAAGADLARGDDIVVQALPFRASSEGVATAPPAPKFPRLVLWALGAGCVAAIIMFLWPTRAGRTMPDTTAAIAVHDALQRELPHTAAYVLSGMPPRVRDRVLREYSVEQRERIIRHLNGRAHG